MFQPGAILHEVIAGALKSKGTGFEAWCRENGLHPTTVRQATYGQSGGDRGQAILGQLIAAAGVDVVEAAYRQRMLIEAQKLGGEVAA